MAKLTPAKIKRLKQLKTHLNELGKAKTKLANKQIALYKKRDAIEKQLPKMSHDMELSLIHI